MALMLCSMEDAQPTEHSLPSSTKQEENVGHSVTVQVNSLGIGNRYVQAKVDAEQDQQSESGIQEFTCWLARL